MVRAKLVKNRSVFVDSFSRNGAGRGSPDITLLVVKFETQAQKTSKNIVFDPLVCISTVVRTVVSPQLSF